MSSLFFCVVINVHTSQTQEDIEEFDTLNEIYTWLITDMQLIMRPLAYYNVGIYFVLLAIISFVKCSSN